MRISRPLMLASVAILALPSCSSAKGPGEIGSKDDIVVRNFGDAPPPPSEEMLRQEAATPPEMMAARTLQGDVPEIDDSEARALAAQHEAEVAAQAARADAVQAQMQAAQQAEIAAEREMQQRQETVHSQAEQLQQQADAQIPRAPEPTQMQRQAMEAQQQALDSGMEAVPAPAVEPATALTQEATRTMSAQDRAEALADATRAGVSGYAGEAPAVNSGLDSRPVPAAPMGTETARVMAPAVEGAATEFQAQPVEQAAQQAMQNPPVSVVNTAQQQPATTQSQQPAPAPQVREETQVPAAAYGARTSFRPSADDIAAGGMRVVTKDDGQVVPAPVHAADVAPMPASAAPAQPMPAPAAVAPAPSAPAPSASQGGVPLMDRAMISRAQAILTEKGFYSGPVDGEMTTALLNALSRYQAANFLTPGGMTVETAQHLGLIQ